MPARQANLPEGGAHVSPSSVLEKRSKHSSEPASNGADAGIQNNIDSLWTWSINGAKIAGSLVIFTGSIKIIQAVLAYWRDEVMTWWVRMQRRWEGLTYQAGLTNQENSQDGY